jgi:hypothetical protein
LVTRPCGVFIRSAILLTRVLFLSYKPKSSGASFLYFFRRRKRKKDRLKSGNRRLLSVFHKRVLGSYSPVQGGNFLSLGSYLPVQDGQYLDKEVTTQYKAATSLTKEVTYEYKAATSLYKEVTHLVK